MRARPSPPSPTWPAVFAAPASIQEQSEDSPAESALRRWSTSAIAVGVLLAGLGGIDSWRSMRRAATEADWVTHTHAARTALEVVFNDCIDVETGARGFAATGDETFLESFSRGQNRLGSDLDMLRSLVADNSAQQQQVDLLGRQTAAMLATTGNVISERKGTGQAPLGLLLEGKHRKDALQATIDTMQEEEGRLLVQRQQSALRSRQRTQAAVLIPTLAGALLLVLAGIVTNQEINRSARMRAQIQTLNADLEGQIIGRTAELRDSEARLRLFIEHAPAALAMFDREMRYLQASRRWRADYGLGNRELLGVSHYDVFPEVSQRWKEAHRRGLAGEVVREESDRFVRHDQGVQWLRWEIRPWYQENGKIGGIVVFTEDITARKQAEDALRESHARLKKVLEVETVGVMFWDLTTGRMVDANDTFLNLMGYSRHDVEAGELTWQKLTPPEYQEVSRAELRKFAASGRIGPYEKEYFHKDGTRQWLVFAGSSLGGNSCVEFCVDISDRKKAEAALRDSEQRVRALMESTAEAILGDDLEGNCTFCNPAALQLLGYENQSDLLGKNLHLTLHHSNAQGMSLSTEDCPIGQAVRGGYPFHADDLVLWRKDGTCFPAECWSHPVFDEGSMVGSVLTFFDISERKGAEETIRQGRAKLAAALASMTDAVLISDVGGRFIEFNESFATFHRFRSKAECAKTLTEYPNFLDVFMASGELAPLNMWAVPRALRGETVTSAEYTLRRKDTGETWAGSYSFAPIRDKNGTVVGSVVVARDITEKKAAEQEIRHLNAELERRVIERTAQLEATNKELEAFTYSVSHDLRAPLRHISGFSRILTEEFGPSLPAEAQRHLQRIQEGTLRMGLLVDDLLNLARIGRQEVRRQVTGLESIVREVIADLTPDTARRTVEWKISDLPYVEADPALLKQVFQNLLSNALKYSRPRPQAIIEIGQLQDDGSPVIFVRDNGVGFSMKYADKLFGVFQRLHRVEDFEGTGVGLATVQRIIQKHGGRVWAEAELDHGATFYFTLGTGRAAVTQKEIFMTGAQA